MDLTLSVFAILPVAHFTFQIVITMFLIVITMFLIVITIIINYAYL